MKCNAPVERDFDIEGLAQQAMPGEGGIVVEGAGTSEAGIETFEDGHDGRGGFLGGLARELGGDGKAA